jgi:hypothetical protein
LEKVDKSVFFAGSFPTGFIGKRRVQDAWRVMRAGAVVGSMCIGWITRHGRHEAHLAQIASLDPEKGVTSVYRTANDHQPTPCAELDWRIHPVRYNQEGAEWLWQHGRTMYKGYFGLLVAVSSAQKRLAKEGLCDYPVPQTDKRTVKRLKAFRK